MKYIDDKGKVKTLSIDPYSDEQFEFLRAVRRILLAALEELPNGDIKDVIEDFLDNNPYLDIKQ